MTIHLDDRRTPMRASALAALAMATLMALSGCARDPLPLQTTSAVTVLETATLPVPASENGAATLGPLDKVQVNVFGIEALDREIQIDGGGRMSFPFVGSIDVTGRTSEEVEHMIARGLRQGYVRDPVVSVNLIESYSQTIAVEGEVEKPGIYPSAGHLTLLRAMALAGGPTDMALTQQIIIFRDVDNARYAGVYDLGALRRGLVDDPRVYSHDTIVVGESPRRKALDRALTIAPALTSPLILLLTRL